MQKRGYSPTQHLKPQRFQEWGYVQPPTFWDPSSGTSYSSLYKSFFWASSIKITKDDELVDFWHSSYQTVDLIGVSHIVLFQC